MMKLIFNILAVCGAGVYAGLLLNVGLGFGGYWQSLTPAEFLDWFAKNNGFTSRGVLVCLIPTLIGLAGSFWLEKSGGHGRILWGVAFLCIIGLLVMTGLYHLPTNQQFAAKSIALEQVPATLNMWLTLHFVRTTLVFIAAIIGVIAVARPAAND